PFLVMPNHMSSYYLEISLIAVVFVIAVALKPLIRIISLPVSKIILVGILSSWIVVTSLSIRAMEQTHWVNRRGELGVILRNQVERQCDQESILIHTDNIQEAEVTLSLDRGAKVLCAKPNIETQYQLEVN